MASDLCQKLWGRGGELSFFRHGFGHGNTIQLHPLIIKEKSGGVQMKERSKWMAGLLILSLIMMNIWAIVGTFVNNVALLPPVMVITWAILGLWICYKAGNGGL
jgi:hypothetical protein